MALLMPLPLTVSCCSKLQIGFTFLVPAHPGSPGQRAVKRVYVCMYVCWLFILLNVIVGIFKLFFPSYCTECRNPHDMFSGLMIAGDSV